MGSGTSLNPPRAKPRVDTGPARPRPAAWGRKSRPSPPLPTVQSAEINTGAQGPARCLRFPNLRSGPCAYSERPGIGVLGLPLPRLSEGSPASLHVSSVWGAPFHPRGEILRTESSTSSFIVNLLQVSGGADDISLSL